MKYLATTILALILTATTVSANEIDYITKVLSQIDSYVTWAPDKTFEGDGSKLVIAAVGETDLIGAIKELNRTKSATGKSIKVRVVEPKMIPSNSHILFLDLSDADQVGEITKKLRGTGTLVICHAPGLASAGASINFVTEPGSDKPTMELNMNIAKEEGLQIKPALLKLAKIVE